MVAGGAEGDDQAPGSPDWDSGGDDGELGASSIFGTPPPILSCLEGGEPDEASRLWIIDEARHLMRTFGVRAILDWHACQRDGCDDAACICQFVNDGVQHYGDWAAVIADVLRACASMAGDEAVEDA